MKPPIFVDDSGDLLVFESVAAAEHYLEPNDIKVDKEIYDSQGRKLKASPTKGTTSFIGIPIKRESVTITSTEKEPQHESQLRYLLLKFLSKTFKDSSFESLSTDQLVQRALKFKTK